MVPDVKETAERDIPVVIIDSGLDEPDLYRQVRRHRQLQRRQDGREAPPRRRWRRRARPRRSWSCSATPPGSESTEQREKGFEDEIKAVIEKQKAEGKPAVEIISDNVYAGATVDTAQAAAGPLLGRIKDQADGIFAVNESATAGMLNAMRSQKLNEKIVLMGFDQSEPLLQAVKEGDVEGLIVQDPYRMGYLAVWTLVRHLEGDDVSAGGKNLSTGEYLVTRDNIDDVTHARAVRPRLAGEADDRPRRRGRRSDMTRRAEPSWSALLRAGGPLLGLLSLLGLFAVLLAAARAVRRTSSACRTCKCSCTEQRPRRRRAGDAARRRLRRHRPVGRLGRGAS